MLSYQDRITAFLSYVYAFYDAQIIPTPNILVDSQTQTKLKLSAVQLFGSVCNICGLDTKKVKAVSYRIPSSTDIANEIFKQKQYRQEKGYIVLFILKIGWISQPRTIKAPSNKGKIIIFNVGSLDGWVPNSLSLSAKNINDSCLEYLCNTFSDIFQDWFKNKSIPKIVPNSVLVMDNFHITSN